jgi:hypothetical protein
MDRIRFVWSSLWAILGRHFIKALLFPLLFKTHQSFQSAFEE